MNDAKWCRIISAIADLPLPVSFWRFLDDDREFKIPTPTPDLVVEQNGNRGIGDFYVAGPFFFRNVEQVRWPASYSHDWFRGYTPATEVQPIEELAKAIDACGKFDYTMDNDGIVLFAYRRLQ